jgi:ubiquitin-like 1-activating enzyme E1 A
MYGFIFADLIAHDFTITRQQSNIPTKLGPESPTCTILDTTTSSTGNGPPTELVTKREIYSPMLLSNTSPLPPFHLSSLRRKLAVTPLLACLRALFDFQALKHAYPSSRSKPDLEHFTTLATQKHQELQLPTETLRADFLRAFLQNVGAELAPVTAFLGGQLAQDALNVIGGREQPIQNWVLFDGEENKGPIYSLHSVFSPLQGVAGLAGAVPGIGTEGRAGLGMGNGALPGGLAM